MVHWQKNILIQVVHFLRIDFLCSGMVRGKKVIEFDIQHSYERRPKEGEFIVRISLLRLFQGHLAI